MGNRAKGRRELLRALFAMPQGEQFALAVGFESGGPLGVGGRRLAPGERITHGLLQWAEGQAGGQRAPKVDIAYPWSLLLWNPQWHLHPRADLVALQELVGDPGEACVTFAHLAHDLQCALHRKRIVGSSGVIDASRLSLGQSHDPVRKIARVDDLCEALRSSRRQDLAAARDTVGPVS